MTGTKVAQALNAAKQERGSLPESITVDNGSEFCSRALEAWAMSNDVQLCFIRPGRPVENGFIESFNGRLFERGMVFVAGRRPSEAGEVPRALQPRAAAQRAGRSDARRIRRVAPVEGEIFYVDGARPPESLDRASGVRENRVNSGKKDVSCPKSLTRFVTENGSGPSVTCRILT